MRVVPPALLQQLRIGGRLVIPVGEEQDTQELIRVTRQGHDDFRREELGGVRFVPLIGAAGWREVDGKRWSGKSGREPSVAPPVRRDLPGIIRDCAEPIRSLKTPDLQPLLDRIGQARLVLIGEASHGTSEFYRMRADITRALIEHKQFDFVAIEADWPDAYRIHDYVTHKEREEPHEWEAFARFPTWMWRNHEVLDFIHWLRDFNLHQRLPGRRVGFYGLDLYSLFTSIYCVLKYLDRVDPEAAAVARVRYGCLSPWQGDPATYGRAALSGRYRNCETEVVQMLRDLSQRRLDRALRDGDDLFDAEMNARLVADAERYYRIMYYGADDSWNLRDTHMFETLKSLLGRYGQSSKAVIWAHNSHLGNAAATQFGKHGQLNIGQLCREKFGDAVYALGFGTDHGTVAAATEWEAPMEIKHVRPAHPESYERAMHLTEMEAFFLPLRTSRSQELLTALSTQRLERAIGVIYRPDTERQSHYFYASLPQQFDEWIWIDETTAIHPLTTNQSAEHEPRHPFATLDE